MEEAVAAEKQGRHRCYGTNKSSPATVVVFSVLQLRGSVQVRVPNLNPKPLTGFSEPEHPNLPPPEPTLDC